MSGSRAWAFIVAALAICSSAAATPAPVAGKAHAYTSSANDLLHTSWTAREGAPTGISQIAQTPDGWLWIGSSSGLYKFDGVRFLRAAGHEAPLSSGISGIGVLRDGTLWVGYKYGGVSLLRQGRMQHFRLDSPDTPASTIFGATLDASGRLWLATGGGLHYLGRDGRWHRPAPGLRAPEGRIHAILLDRRGVLWLRTLTGVYALQNGAMAFDLRMKAQSAGNLAEHPDGSIWTTDDERPGIHMVSGPDRGPALAWPAPRVFHELIFDHAGFGWATSEEGIDRLASSADTLSHVPAWQFRTDQGLSGRTPAVLFEDREHNVWLATENGLDRFRLPRLKAIALPSYKHYGARPIAAGPGSSAWIDYSYLESSGSAARPFTARPAFADTITALHRAPDGTVWAGGNGGQLWTAGATGLRPIPPLPGIKATCVYALSQDKAGSLWVSMGRAGLYTWRAGQWSPGGGVPELASFAASAIATDSQGRVWFGSVNNRLAVLRDGQLRQYSQADGLDIGTVMHILPMQDGAWVGGENGLSYFDGKRFLALKGWAGEPFAGITGLVFSRDGTLWINGGDGISSIAPAELVHALRDPAYKVHFHRLDHRDGVVGSTSPILPVPSAARSEDGTLWFSTTGGVYAFDPGKLMRNPLVPPVVITGFKSGADNHALVNGIRLPAGTDMLSLDFSALSYQEPERMRFQYRLEGVDAGWRESDGRRSAYYTNLGPGAYRFRVVASNNDGIWNREGTSLSFHIEPRLIQTMWFRACCVAALLGGLLGIYHWRSRRQAERYRERMQERLAERERIARTLHDTLLQSMQGLILRFQGVAKRLPADSETRRLITPILEQAGKVMAHGRDELLDLRSPLAQQDDLVQSLDEFGRSLAEDLGPGFKLTVTGAAKPINATARHEIHGIGREALFNAYRHAQAGHVDIDIVHGPRHFCMVVRDNGIGIPEDVLRNSGRKGHWGLAGMQERAAAMGGTIELQRRHPAGTQVSVRLPARRVYAQPDELRLWPRLRALFQPCRYQRTHSAIRARVWRRPADTRDDDPPARAP
ncbi:sensor histidine kinase [Pseudoduganella umbonata]|uniref:Signal transduction histidine kinase/ligand-binding sensor domain-containing protein n=1 Tax=Pseudoduganella umbonata TaxID=864828 RepID=A0A4P8HQ96_9BURK|nr:sensor histidine kinase [Pseudoduganella umbonata]MBB3220542.1 signal transduction histidine kinase/ligand-binding sensor domain-containing protein [Pseudoduganella umbonata]QCP11947.1 hypothetical protein FCL38_17140 [Pseudoduganella umbonata]